jgi:hypothetical protein
MSRTHGWKPRPKFTCGLNVSEQEWQRIFGKRLSAADQQRDMNLIQKPAPSAQSPLDEMKSKS